LSNAKFDIEALIPNGSPKFAIGLTIMEYTIHYDDSSFYIILFLDRWSQGKFSTVKKRKKHRKIKSKNEKIKKKKKIKKM